MAQEWRAPLTSPRRIPGSSAVFYDAGAAGDIARFAIFDEAVAAAAQGGDPAPLPHLGLVLAAGGGSTVELVASAWSRSLAYGVVPVARSLSATARSRSRAAAAVPVARVLIGTGRSTSRAVSAAQVARVLSAAARSASRAGAVAPVARSLSATARSRSLAGGVSPVLRALIATARSRSTGSGAAVVARLLQATAYSRGSAYVVVTITPSGTAIELVATAWSHSRALAVVPVARAMVASTRSTTRANGVSPSRALQATARSISRAFAVAPVARGLRASGFSRSYGGSFVEIEVAQWASATARGAVVVLMPGCRFLDASPAGSAQTLPSPAAGVETLRPDIVGALDLVGIEADLTRR